jgi:hypothetical protein
VRRDVDQEVVPRRLSIGEREASGARVHPGELMLGVIADSAALHHLPHRGGNDGPGDAHGTGLGRVEVEFDCRSPPLVPKPGLDQHGRLVGGRRALVGGRSREDGHPSSSKRLQCVPNRGRPVQGIEVVTTVGESRNGLGGQFGSQCDNHRVTRILSPSRGDHVA